MENEQSGLNNADKMIKEFIKDSKLDDIELRLKELNERTTEFVKKNPLTSVAIAAVIGFMLGRLFSGRRR